MEFQEGLTLNVFFFLYKSNTDGDAVLPLILFNKLVLQKLYF